MLAILNTKCLFLSKKIYIFKEYVDNQVAVKLLLVAIIFDFVF